MLRFDSSFAGELACGFADDRCHFGGGRFVRFRVVRARARKRIRNRGELIDVGCVQLVIEGTRISSPSRNGTCPWSEASI